MTDEDPQQDLDDSVGMALGLNIDEAIKATKNGSTAAFISAGITLLVVVIAISTSASGELQVFNDPWNLVDALLIAALGFGIRQHSRVAAVSMLVYFILAKILIALETGTMAGILVSLIFLYYFGAAARGAIAYHRIQLLADPSYSVSSKWAYRIGIPVGLLALALIVLGILSEVGVVPSTAVVAGSELSNTDKTTLVEMGVIEPGESVIMFYSAGLMTIRTDGNLLTDRRIISYEDLGDGLYIYSVPYDEVEAVNLYERGGPVTDTVMEVWPRGRDAFRLLLSAEDGGDIRFISALNDRLPQESRLTLD